MTVSLLAKNKLKITLDAAELRTTFGDYRQIDYRDPDTRCALGRLLREAAWSADFELDCDRVRIEVYPTSLGGCAIYFTKSDRPLRPKTRYRRVGRPARQYVLEFRDASGLIDAVAAFAAVPALRAAASRLYRMTDGYRLTVAVNAETAAAVPFLAEYCGRVLQKPLDLAYTEEYGTLLQDGFAIREIGRFFRPGAAGEAG